MAGFGDLPVGDNSLFANSGPTQATATPASSGGGGIGGFIYNHLIQPTVKSVAGGLSDIPKIGSGLYDLGRTAAAGATNNQIALQNALKAQQDLFKGTNFHQSYLAPSEAAYASGNFGKGIEQGLGSAGTNISNILAPVAGGGESSILGLAKVGGELGLAQGASSAMQQGASGGDVINSGLAGGALGTLAGGAGAIGGKLLGAAGGKIAAKIAPDAENVAVGDAATASANPFKSMVDKAATNKAQNAYADQVQSEFGLGGKTLSDNGTPIGAVLKQLQSHRIEPTVSNMAQYGNAGFGYNDFLHNVVLPQGKDVALNLDTILNDAVKDQPGLRASIPQIKGELRNTINGSIAPDGNISGLYHPGDLLQAATDLYNAKPANAAEAAVYNKARQGLIEAAGKEGGLNSAIEGSKLPSVSDIVAGNQANNPGATTVQHFLDISGNNPTLAQELVDNVNKAKTIQDIQRAEIPHIAANDLAQSHAQAIGESLPVTSKGPGFSSSGSPSGAYYATKELMNIPHNPLMALPLAARTGQHVVGDQLARLGEADLSQVGPRAIPSLEASPTLGAPVTAPAPAIGTSGKLSGILAGLSGNAAGGSVAPSAPTPQAAMVTPGEQQSLDTLTGLTQQDSTAQSDMNSPYSQSAMLSDITRDPKNAATYQSLYKTLNPTKSPLSTAQQNSVLSIKDAATAVNNYITDLLGLGGQTGVGKGSLNVLLGRLGVGEDNKKLYGIESQRTDLSTQLAKATTNGKPSSAQINFWKESLPSAGDSNTAIETKLKTLTQNLHGYLDNASAPIGAGVSPDLQSTAGVAQ